MMITTTDRAVRTLLLQPGETAASDNDSDSGDDSSAGQALQPGMTLLLPGVVLAAILAAVGLM
ncbi:hypothetical protein XPA_006847 [Xanthoria parietina]